MAIVNNFYLRNQKKKLAGAVYYQAMGQTRSRELRTEISNPRTQAQMEQRTKWANLVNFYRVNAPWMKYAYETKARNQSEYNKFMSLNVPSARIYLPKNFASQGGCIVDAYQMTQGSLASIEFTKSGSFWVSNIILPSTFDFTKLSTVGEVSAAILQMNPAIREGDQLSFIRLTQQVNSNTGVPFVVVRRYEVIINSNDFRPFYDFMPVGYVTATDGTGTFNIAIRGSGNAGGFLLILSRTISGKTYVSTQSIIVANNDALISQYSSASARQAAIDSYGESEDAFLTTTAANENEQAAVTPSIVGVTVDNVARNIGESFYPAGDLGGSPVRVQFSQIPGDTVDNATMDVTKGGTTQTIALTDRSISGGVVSATVPDSFESYQDFAVSDIKIQVGETVYRAPFLVPNEATIGGLE